MSTPTVKVIDKRSVHQICSGQVVVTLATAVKELVENSLDAGATNVEVRLKNWGSDSLEVVDNGSGVLPENFAALALKHHTSKLNVFADLVGVETFGFRGEALSSLCALGNLTITTCHKTQDIGTRIEYDHDGHITKEQATPRTHGTTVTLQNLFSTLPVRHKEFQRNIKREYTKMMQVLQGYCVISTGVRISCYTIGEKGKKSMVLATHANSDMKGNISNVFGPKQLQTLLELKQINPTSEDCDELGLDVAQLESNPVFILTGFVSRCDHGAGRSANDRQYIFINKRPCDMPKLTRLVNEVYHAFNRNQYPFLSINIDLRKDLVDLNVTPDKRQVFLQQEKLLLATMKSSLKAMYDPGGSNYETNQKPLNQIKLPFMKRKENEEKTTNSFSKSIKDRLFAAVKVSKNKEMSSILKFTTTVPPSAEEKLDNFSEVETEEAVSYTITSSAKILPLNASEGGLFGVTSVRDVPISKNKVGNLPSETKEESKDKVFTVENNTNFGESINKNTKCNIKDLESIQKEDNELQNLTRDENKCEPLEEEKPYENSEHACQSFNIMHEKYSCDSRALKRGRTSDICEVQCNTKKVKLDQECENDFGKSSRKSITVNFDLHGLPRSRTFRATIAPESNQKAEEELQKHITKEMFSKMEIIGQFNQGFLITKLEEDLFIIDQHASDEKYNFEEQQKNTVLKSQRLICPRSLELTAVNESILMENLEVFRKNGFDFEINEDAPISERVKLASLPVSRNWSFGKSDIDELIFLLSDSPGVNYRPSNIRKMFASRACRMSVMVGTALNDGQMRRIVGHMGEMDHPWNCPHGRPTMRHLINLNMIRK
ncbi:mismatch repair endonuclease PMS2-like [Dendronephthya gigantea]|uniref:mismatch repair endonuclease PMS2-like n=1 Tax=Dendronephthya gigantea TaxID=151771 RepID=UPI00106A9FBD|nr:mismatch repair endonuclease PMS2-like [Dendronephthya gigantea]